MVGGGEAPCPSLSEFIVAQMLKESGLQRGTLDSTLGSGSSPRGGLRQPTPV